MEKLSSYITEKLKIGDRPDLPKYSYHPKTNKELCKLIDRLVRERGPEADLNDIDVSGITDMQRLFYMSEFDGDISDWDVSNVTNMDSMFCNSDFKGDISGWDVSNVTDMDSMFCNSDFEGDISGWDVGKVKNMKEMFWGSSFRGDLSKWNPRPDCYTARMFEKCPLKDNPPAWWKP